MFGEKFDFEEAATGLKDIKEVLRWTYWVRTQVRIGIELEKAGHLESPADGRAGRRNNWDAFNAALEPSGSFDKLSRYNVMQVVDDGSVNGDGIEVLVIGTNEDFVTAHQKMLALHKVINDWGLKADRSCGMHYHLIAAQDDVMPEVILKNFYQLSRRYYAALLFLMSTNGGRESILRSGDMHFFRPAHLRFSPLGQHMKDVKEQIYHNADRYTAFNMGTIDGGHKDLLRFRYNDISRFHVEMRFPDASDVPAQIVAQMFLFRALLMRAVELSRFGVIKISDDEGKWTKNKEAVKALAVEGGSTEMTFEQAYAFAQNDARNLIKALRPILVNIDGQSVRVLNEIADKPIWQRRRGRQSWTAIESALMPRERVLDDVAEKLLKAITLQQVTGIKQKSNWKAAAATYLGVPQNLIVNALREIQQEVRLDYDIELGTYVPAW